MVRGPVTIAALFDAIPADLRVRLALTGATGAATPVVDATHDSRQVTPGSLFVCVVGTESDGHGFAPEALAAGAVALVVERELELDVPQLVVADSRRAHGHVAAAVHGHPAASLTTVGVTGTNGKTTTTHLLAAALRGAGRDVAVVGTLSGTRTTPEASDLQRTLATMRDRGTDSVVMEVSSHALALHRVDGMRVDAAVFTNLGRDHLDLHDSMEDYFRAKARLFTPALAAIGIVNADDAHGRLLLDVGELPIHPFHLADASDVRVGPGEHRFRWRDREVVVPLGGDVNVANSLAALTTCDALGVDLDRAVGGLASAEAVPGRFELVGVGLDHGFSVVVDYAHTPDGLATVLGSARRLADGGRVIVVFGCGGDRDRDKRGLMGAVAGERADLAIVTSDNPRREEPAAIIADVLAGVPAGYRDRLVVDEDRRAAIATALGAARRGDVVVIAGKGHETTQTIGATAHPFDDRVVAREILEGLT